MLKGCRNAYALRHPCFCVKSGLPFLERPLFNYYVDRVKVNDVEGNAVCNGRTTCGFACPFSRAASRSSLSSVKPYKRFHVSPRRKISSRSRTSM